MIQYEYVTPDLHRTTLMIIKYNNLFGAKYISYFIPNEFRFSIFCCVVVIIWGVLITKSKFNPISNLFNQRLRLQMARPLFD